MQSPLDKGYSSNVQKVYMTRLKVVNYNMINYICGERRELMRSVKGVFAFSVILTLLIPVTGLTQASAEQAGDYQTKANIRFEENTGQGPEVLDPEKPVIEEPVKPTDPDVKPGTNGPLSIDYVSNFHFGTQTISGNGATYYADLPEIKTSEGELKKVSNYVQVTDDRANGRGWTLSVKQEGQFKAGDNVLDGAELSLANLNLTSPYSKQAPQGFDVVLDPTGKSASIVLMADERKGMGTWLGSFGKNDKEGTRSIALTVPAEQIITIEDEYKTKLRWILADTPI